MATFLLNLLFGFLAKFIGSFAAKLSAAVADNPSLMDAAYSIVSYAKANIAVVIISVLLLGGGVALDRSQITVDDTAYMRAMIPHHSLAITRSERAQIQDVRVCRLAVEISEAQRREILEMDWLINDIERNGLATTPEDAQSRPIPNFDRTADRECPDDE